MEKMTGFAAGCGKSHGTGGENRKFIALSPLSPAGDDFPRRSPYHEEAVWKDPKNPGAWF
jgi:hypothetical protein